MKNNLLIGASMLQVAAGLCAFDPGFYPVEWVAPSKQKAAEEAQQACVRDRELTLQQAKAELEACRNDLKEEEDRFDDYQRTLKDIRKSVAFDGIDGTYAVENGKVKVIHDPKKEADRNYNLMVPAKTRWDRPLYRFGCHPGIDENCDELNQSRDSQFYSDRGTIPAGEALDVLGTMLAVAKDRRNWKRDDVKYFEKDIEAEKRKFLRAQKKLIDLRAKLRANQLGMPGHRFYQDYEKRGTVSPFVVRIKDWISSFYR